MWSEKNEKEFQALIKKYQDDPRQNPSQDDVDLIQNLMKCYVEAELAPMSEVKFFKKLSDFYNVFLESYIKDNSELFKDYTAFDKVLKNSPPDVGYPFLSILKRVLKTQSDRQQQKASTAYIDFVKKIPLNSLLSEQEIRFLNPDLFYGSLYTSPKFDPRDISTFSYDKMTQKIYDAAEAKHQSELKLVKERDALISAFYYSCRTRSLSNLNGLYRDLCLERLGEVPHIFYNSQNRPHIHPEYSASFIQDVLPHPAFEKVAKLYFQKARKDESGKKMSALMAQLLGKIAAEENQIFSSYNVIAKTSGKDPGFILASLDGRKRYYAKYTGNTVPEYFASKVLSHLGIKMPEAQLLTDEYGNQFYVTLDISREYTKRGHLKTKKFLPFSEELNAASEVAFNFGRKEPKRIPKEEQEILVQAFIEKATSTEKSRQSFAKLLLVGVAFGLNDIGRHGGNVGVIKAKKGDQHYNKFGIVDFQFNPSDITGENFDQGFLEFMREQGKASGMQPIFIRIFEVLTSEDFLAAAEDLARPKSRSYTKEGLLLMNSPLSRVTNQEIIKDIFKEMVNELRNKLPVDEQKILMERLELQKNIMVKNLDFLVSAIRKIDLKGDKEKKLSLDKMCGSL